MYKGIQIRRSRNSQTVDKGIEIRRSRNSQTVELRISHDRQQPIRWPRLRAAANQVELRIIITFSIMVACFYMTSLPQLSYMANTIIYRDWDDASYIMWCISCPLLALSSVINPLAYVGTQSGFAIKKITYKEPR